MDTKNKISELICQSIVEINELHDFNLILEPDAILFGKESDLDSLGLVNLIVSVEDRINIEFNVAISLVNDKAMSQKHSPFRSVKSLTDYILELLKEIV
jgi:acyl carrier protein